MRSIAQQKNRTYTKYNAEKKTNVNVCPKMCVTLSQHSCLIADKKNFQIKIDFFKQTRPHGWCNWINILDKQKAKLRQHLVGKVTLCMLRCFRILGVCYIKWIKTLMRLDLLSVLVTVD